MTDINAIKFCTQCGNPVTLTIPAGDNRQRHVCTLCGEIQYQNPKIVAGCIPIWDDRILLCQRAIEPRKGYWTIPAGFLENGETIEEGATRETREEACADIIDPHLYQIYNIPRIGQVYILFRGQLRGLEDFGVGEESTEVKLVEERNIPWDDIAFKVVRHTLLRFFAERRAGKFNFMVDSIR